jgi:hypothetical protein
VPEPTIIPTTTWKVWLYQNRLLGMTTANTVMVLDRDGQRAVHVALPLQQQSERAVNALLAGGRLVVLTSRAPGAVVSTYALP